MQEYTEGNLKLIINNSNAKLLEQDNVKVASFRNYMKKVDFVIEFPDYYAFIEFKDYSGLSPEIKREKYQNMQTGRILKYLYYKYRDNLLSCWMEKKINCEKPIRYYVLLDFVEIDEAKLINLAANLKRALPLVHSKEIRPIAKSAMVFNFKTWNEKLSEDLKIERINNSNVI